MSKDSTNSSITEDRPGLLNLPRELRNLIIDNVLRSPITPPTPTRHDPQTPVRNIHYPVSVPSTRVVHCSLARTNAQLRAETLDRASKIDLPLVLDILVLEDGHTQCTWLSAPLTPRKLHKITMEIGVRIRPVNMTLVQFAAGRQFVTVSASEIHSARDHARHQLEYKVVNSIRTAVLAILFDDDLLPTMRVSKAIESGRLENYYPVNSIAKLSVTVRNALDDNKREIRTPPGKDYALWYQPNIFPPAFTRELARNLSGPFLGFGPVPPCPGRVELFYRPILTNVRIISVSCDENPTIVHIYDVGFEFENSAGRGRENVKRKGLGIEEMREKIWPKFTSDNETDTSLT